MPSVMTLVGRLINIENNVCKLKMLKSYLDSFIWPQTSDIELIEKQFIFYGPINLCGSGQILWV